MSFRANVIKVFIASPSDVLEERKLIRDAIHEWNDMHAAERSLVLLPVGWETHSAPSMAGKAQKVINSELLEDCDVLIAVFWTRLGTPTENDPSGTAEEIREHIGRDRHAMLYFSDAKASPSEVNAEQYKAVTAFRQEQMEKGLVESYESIDDFRRLLPRQIERLVKREIARLEAGMPSEFRGYVPDPLTRIKLSEEAERILYCAANADGSVLQLQTGGGNYVQFGNSIEPQNSTPRNQALWGAAVEELEGAGYIRDVGHDGQSFEVTKVGYEIADSLTAPAEKPHPLLNLAGTVASALCDLVELGLSYPARRINPAHDSMIHQWKYAGERLRSAAASEDANDNGWNDELIRVAEGIDQLTSYTRTIGNDGVSIILPDILKNAEALYAKRVIPIPIPSYVEQDSIRRARELAREYIALSRKFDAAEFPRDLEDAQRSSELTGFYLLQSVWWGLHKLPKERLEPLREVSRGISLVSTMRTYADGGISQRAVVARMQELSGQLTEAVTAISAKPL